MTILKAKISVNIEACVRCGANHMGVSVKPLANPQDEFEWWGFCPVTEEPFWVKIESAEK